MLNWIKFITAFLLTLGTVISITIFYSAHKPVAAVKKNAEELALQSGQIVSIHDIQPYNGTTSIVTVFGRNEDGEQIALFVQSEEEEVFQFVRLQDGITSSEAMDIVLKEQQPEKIMHVLLGLEENEPIWEVAFKNKHGKLNYVYIRFADGEWSKRILNL